MNDVERKEVEEYEKLLENWKPGPGAPPGGERPTPGRSKPSMKHGHGIQGAQAQPAAGAHQAYQPGAILVLNSRTVAIYKQPVPEKGYHLVQVLYPNNAVKTQGVALEGYEVEQLGELSGEAQDKLQREMRWDRDMIVFHCYSLEDVKKVPATLSAPAVPTGEGVPKTTPSSDTVPSETAEKTRLRRGQKIKVSFGNNTWEAVYWGKDDQGPVVAHKTHEEWQLMHLDLERFGSGLKVEPEIDEELVEQIEASLLKG